MVILRLIVEILVLFTKYLTNEKQILNVKILISLSLFFGYRFLLINPARATFTAQSQCITHWWGENLNDTYKNVTIDYFLAIMTNFMTQIRKSILLKI